MTAQTEKALEALMQSKKYACVAEDAARRAVESAYARYASPKDADKAARRALHALTGAYLETDALKAARKCLERYRAGDESALEKALSLHASTRERPNARALYEKVLAFTGRGPILDMACGFNPLLLGAMGLSVRGWDANGGAAALVNDWANACGWDVRVQTSDLLTQSDFPEGHIALFMKLFPLLERQEAGAAMRLFARVQAPYKLITFPARTLSGRDVGMEENYGRWLEEHLPPTHKIVWKEVADGELCCLTEETHG